MKFSSSKRVNRKEQEEGKVMVLSELEWLVKISMSFNLPKEVYYRSIISFRRFLQMCSKAIRATLNKSKLRLMGLASISLNSKLECIGMKFS